METQKEQKQSILCLFCIQFRLKTENFFAFILVACFFFCWLDFPAFFLINHYHWLLCSAFCCALKWCVLLECMNEKICIHIYWAFLSLLSSLPATISGRVICICVAPRYPSRRVMCFRKMKFVSQNLFY